MVSYSSLCLYWKWPKKLHKLQLVLVISACFLTQLCLGSVLLYGDLVPYVVSYIRLCSSPQNLRMADTGNLYAVQLLVFSISTLVGGALVKRLGVRVVVVYGGMCLVTGIAFSYFSLELSYYALFLSYGLVYGFGVGVAYTGPIACAMNWLPNWKGLASAIVTSGYGISPLFFGAVITAFLNPSSEVPNYVPYSESPNEKYFTQPEILRNVPELFLVLAASSVIILTLVSPLLVNPHRPSYNQETTMYVSRDHQPFTDSSTENSSPRNMQVRRRVEEEVSPVEMLRKMSFYLFWFKFMIVSSILSYFVTLYESFGSELVTDNGQFLTTVRRFAAIFSALGGLAFGLLADFVDSTFALVLQSALTSCIIFTFYATSVVGEVMYFIWVCGIFFCIGGSFSLYPSAIAKHYGTENFSINYGIVNTSGVFGPLIALLISQLLLHHFGSWQGSFFFFGGLSCVDCILTMLLHCTS